MSWYTRASLYVASSRAGLFYRSMLFGLAALRAPRPRPGITSGRVASLPLAELDLSALASSPTVYGAVTRRALEFINHPIVVYRGYSIGGGSLTPIDDDNCPPWVDYFLRLLQSPDPLSADEIAPEPGEALIAQIVADIILTGTFAIAPTLGEDKAPIGLARLHPGCCSIERTAGVEELVYRNGSDVRRYPRTSVFVGRMLSWAKDGRSEFGVGAGTPLRPVVRAEAVALEQTANMIEQGGADLIVTGSGATGKNFMAVPENRAAALKTVMEMIKGPLGRRAMVMSNDIEVKTADIKPADLKAPEFMNAARAAELVATGTVPAWVGADSSTFSTAVIQLRVQAGNDEGIASLIEAFFFRPLARYCAKTKGRGTMDAKRTDKITARIDMSQHQGYAQFRTEAYARARVLVHDLGFTVEQACRAEHLDLPKPLGTILSKGLPSADQAAPGPEQGSHLPGPRDPVGDNGDGAIDKPKSGARGHLTLVEFFEAESLANQA